MDIILIGVKMAAGFLAAVVAVALWSHTRESSWLFVILATIIAYLEVLADFLNTLGVFSIDFWSWEGVSVVQVIFSVTVPLLYAIGLTLALRSIYRVK